MPGLIEDLTEEQRKEINDKIDKILHYNKINRKGSKVFCVSCGAINKTLYKYGKVYLCRDCKKKVEAREKT